MTIANKYFEVLKNKGEVAFFQLDGFVREFIRQCRKRGISVKLVKKDNFFKVVKRKESRFYVQQIDFNYDTREWTWKLYAKAETYEEALKRINGSMYSHCGDKNYRILDRLEKIYY